jgi:hypothetical protein
MSQNDGKIIYALIAYENVILCEYSSFTGAFRETCRPYLSKVKAGGQASIRLDENESIIYYLNSNNITYLIMTNTSYQISSAIGCLQSIQKEFEETFPNNYGLKTNKELCLNDQFQQKLSMKYNFFNEHPEASTESIGRLTDEMNQFKDDITKASGLLDERSEKLEVLSVKSDQLKGTSNSYYKSSKRVRRAELMKKIKMYAIIACSILLIIYILTIIICGNLTFCI